MKKNCIVLVILLLLPFRLLAFEKTIPVDSTYIGLKVDSKINLLLNKLLAPSFKGIFYPDGTIGNSPLNRIIMELKNQQSPYIEVFNNTRWGTLVKFNIIKPNNIILVITKILEEEGFDPVVKKENSTKTIITSKSPDFEGNQFYIVRDKNTLLISNNLDAFEAWKSRNYTIPFYNEIINNFKKEGNSNLMFSFSANAISAQGLPYFLSVTSSDKTFKTLSVHTLFQSKNNMTNLQAPPYLSNNPKILFTGSVDSLERILHIAPKGLFTPIQAILHSSSSAVSFVNFVFNNGDLSAITTQHYSSLDAALIVHSSNTKLMAEAITKIPEQDPMIHISHSSIGGDTLLTLSTKTGETISHLYALVQKETLILSMDKNSILTLKHNMDIKKSSLLIASKNSTNVLTFMNVSELISSFPILSSLASQFGTNLMAVKSLWGFNIQTLSPNIYAQSFLINLI